MSYLRGAGEYYLFGDEVGFTLEFDPQEEVDLREILERLSNNDEPSLRFQYRGPDRCNAHFMKHGENDYEVKLVRKEPDEASFRFVFHRFSGDKSFVHLGRVIN